MRNIYASMTKEQAIEAITAISGVDAHQGYQSIDPDSVIAAVNAKGRGCVTAVHAVLAITDADIGTHWCKDTIDKCLTCDARKAIRVLYRDQSKS